MPEYTGIHHLAFATGDMDRTVGFWRDLIGLRLVLAGGRAGARSYFFEVSPTDLIGFFEWPGVEPAPLKDHGYPVRGPFTFDHIALGVKSMDDLWAVYDKLTAAGLEVSEVIDHGFIPSIYAFDPNNILNPGKIFK